MFDAGPSADYRCSNPKRFPLIQRSKERQAVTRVLHELLVPEAQLCFGVELESPQGFGHVRVFVRH